MVELASGRHGEIAMRIGVAMANYAHGKGLGEVLAAGTGFLVERDPDVARSPDVAFVSARRVPKEGLSNSGPVPFGPDIAVEVLSETDSFLDVENKIEPWLNAGANCVWIVNPGNKTIITRRVSAGQKILLEGDVVRAEDVLPGFEMDVAWVFGR